MGSNDHTTPVATTFRIRTRPHIVVWESRLAFQGPRCLMDPCGTFLLAISEAEPPWPSQNRSGCITNPMFKHNRLQGHIHIRHHAEIGDAGGIFQGGVLDMCINTRFYTVTTVWPRTSSPPRKTTSPYTIYDRAFKKPKRKYETTSGSMRRFNFCTRRTAAPEATRPFTLINL